VVLKKRRKQKVVGIDQCPATVDVLSDNELERVAELQALAWQAHRSAAAAALELETRIRHGATIESERYWWDPELKMVRSRRAS
jgi:peptide subunit release factor 1 (eRF1)